MVGVAEPAMTVLEISPDSVLALLVVGIIGVGERESLEGSKLGLDKVEPGSLRRRPDRMDVQLLEEAQEPGMVVDKVQVVEDDEQLPTGIAASQPAEDLAYLFDAAMPFKHTIQVIAVNVVEGQKVLDSVGSVIGGAPADRTLGRRPRGSAHGTDLQRAPLVEAQHDRPSGAVAVELLD
jgi:hypothetical protein